MSKTKNNRLLIPLISVNAHDSRAKNSESRGLRDMMRKKQLLLKAYENDSPVMLPRNRYRKQQNRVGGISFQQKPTLQQNTPNLRYGGGNKLDLSDYLQEEKLNVEPNKKFISRSSRARPGSLFKIPEKSSANDIQTQRHQRDRSEQRIEMSQNHSVDLFKAKQNSQRRYSRIDDRGKNLLEMGRKLYREGKTQQAEKVFLQAILQDPKMLQAYYFIAVINLNSRQFESAVQNLNKVINLKPDYKKSVYLFMCIALKNLDRKEEAVLMASKGLALFPSYYDMLVYRAKLYQADGIYDLAEKDYDSALVVRQDSAEAFYKKGQCCVLAKEYKKAVSALTTAIYIDQGFKLKALQERARAYLALNHNTEARKDIDKIIAQQPISSENFELKGIILTREGSISQAALAFEQCLKNATSKTSMANALVQITKFKILDRDFYSAYHHICRSDFLELSSSAIDMYRLFAEGVVFLMKRKTTQGLTNLNKLEQKYPKMDDFIIKLFYLYRAYGHFVSGQHKLCLQDYSTAEKHQQMDRHTVYNSFLAYGIVRAKEENYEKSMEYFNKAQEILPGKVEPLLYRSVVYVLSARKEFPQDEIKRLEGVFLALKELDKAYDVNNAHSNQLFLRALVYYYLGKITQGLEDIGRAISKSEQNVPKYFFYRGMGQGTLRNYKQCQNDLTICINLDQTFTQAYYQRAKAFFLQRQTQKALQDLAKYVQLQPKNSQHFLQGNLYFGSGDFEQAIKRYKLALPTKQSQTMLAKSFVIISEYTAAAKVLKEMVGKYPDEFGMDLAIVELLEMMSKNAIAKEKLENIRERLDEAPKVVRQGVFSELHGYHYLGVCLFYLANYEEAHEEFSKAYKERELMNIENELDSRDLRNALNSEESQDEDPSVDRELHEINYNQFLCQLALGEYKKAYEQFIRDIVPAKQNVFQNDLLAVFGRILFQTLKKQAPASTQPGHPEQLELTLFQNSLSPMVPAFELQLRGCKVKTKPCLLSLPIKLQQIYPQIHPKSLLLKITMQQVQNKPQPPWVKRNDDQNLVFTNDIQQADDVEFNTEENQEDEEEEAEDQYEEEDDEEGDEEEEQAKPDIQKIKKAMRLDDSVEQKLNRLIKGSKNT